ncbi:MAG TPA: DNA polymerase III subunit epsilon [Burkholderiales bacterium]|nr:DNA polymerase III subunit epsilon [Burkholderiales bacterium]
MRQIVLDTETTGLEVALGHRIIEIAGVEIINRRLTGRHFHKYLNPQRDIEQGALQVHGLTLEFLQDKPLFADIVAELIEFVDGSELIIHNAAFDVSFLDSELALAALKPISAYCQTVTDTLRMARELHPGKRNSLDALCERYQIDNSARTLHGALLDAELLAEVYLSMTRGQETLMMDVGQPERTSADLDLGEAVIELIVISATEEELAAHQRQLEDIDRAAKGACVWKRLDAVGEGLAA